MVGAYFPPGPTVRRARANYFSTVQGMITWLRSVFQNIRGRSILILAVDLNDGMGMEDIAGSYEYTNSS
eukprot:141981-Pyramimonas_sp.AAC.1